MRMRRKARRLLRRGVSALLVSAALCATTLIGGWWQTAAFAAGLAVLSGGESYLTKEHTQLTRHVRWRGLKLPFTKGQVGNIMMVVGTIMILVAIAAIAAKI